MKDRENIKGPLHAATLDLHHYVEQSVELGRAVASGLATTAQFVAWLAKSAWLFDMIERHIPTPCQRSADFRRDIACIWSRPLPPKPRAIELHEVWLFDRTQAETELERRMTGTIYVCCGAAFGSAVIAKAINTHRPHLQTSSLLMKDRQTELAYLAQLRQRGDCVVAARRTFRTVADACEELQAWAAAQPD